MCFLFIYFTSISKVVDKMQFVEYNKHRKRQDLKRLCQKNVFIKITLHLTVGVIFFMEITKSNRIIINVIMYSLSIATTSL